MEWAKVYSSNKGSTTGPGMVGACFPSAAASSVTAAQKRSDHHHQGRRIRQLWMGRTLIKGGVLSRSVVSPGSQVSHQQEGDMGRSFQPGQAYGTRGSCAAVPGQHDCGGLHKQDGRDTLAAPMLGSHRALGHGVVQRMLGDSSVAVTGRKSVIRYAEQDTSCSLGILRSAKCSGSSVGPLVPTYSGCFRQQGLSRPPRILQLVPGQGSSGSGCILGGQVAAEDLCLSTGSSDTHGIGEDRQGSVDSHLDSSRVEISTMVGSDKQHAAARASQSRGLQEGFMVSQGEGDTISPASVGMLGGEDEHSLLSDQAALLVDQDVRPATHKLYKSRFSIFSEYCAQYGFDPKNCPVEIVTNFLAMLQDTKRLQYRTICGYRSAIARYHNGFTGNSVGSARLIKRLTKACFNKNPPLPKYSDIWDADVLLAHLETMYPNSTLSTYDLGLKAVSLLTVLSLSRQSSLAVLGPQFDTVDSFVEIPLVGLEKTGRPASFRTKIKLPSGNSHPPLSLSECLGEYLARTEPNRQYFSNAEGFRPSVMFISNLKPYQGVKPATLAKWLLVCMDRAGICTDSYRANSVRSAGASGLRTKGMSLAQVLARGNWSPATRTFSIFYDRSGVDSRSGKELDIL